MPAEENENSTPTPATEALSPETPKEETPMAPSEVENKVAENGEKAANQAFKESLNLPQPCQVPDNSPEGLKQRIQSAKGLSEEDKALLISKL